MVLWGAATLLLAVWLPRMRSPGFPPSPLPWMLWVPTGFATVWGLAVIWHFSGRGRAAWQFHLGVVGRGLAGSAALATFLSAVQLLPVLEFSRQTIRAAAPESHDIYVFSIEPFRLLELAWPNVLGVHFERSTYWRDAFNIGSSNRAVVAVALRGGPEPGCWLAAGYRFDAGLVARLAVRDCGRELAGKHGSVRQSHLGDAGLRSGIAVAHAFGPVEQPRRP